VPWRRDRTDDGAGVARGRVGNEVHGVGRDDRGVGDQVDLGARHRGVEQTADSVRDRERKEARKVRGTEATREYLTATLRK